MGGLTQRVAALAAPRPQVILISCLETFSTLLYKMADNLPVRKIYIDSRFKAASSESHSDFHYDLPQSISLPDNVICYVDNIVIPNSWKTIDANNNKLYARLTVYPSGGGGAPIKNKSHYHTNRKYL